MHLGKINLKFVMLLPSVLTLAVHLHLEIVLQGW